MTMRRCCSGCQVRTTTMLPSRGGPPVDRAHVVALDVVAEGVELGALAAGPHRRAAVELPQLGEPARQVLARAERRQGPDRAGHDEDTLPGGQPQRAVHPQRHPVGQPVAAPGRRQRRRDTRPLPGPKVDRVTGSRTLPPMAARRPAARPRTRRDPALATVRMDSAVSPSRLAGIGPRLTRRSWGRGARRASRASRTTVAATHQRTVVAEGQTTAATIPSGTSQSARWVRAIGQRGTGTEASADSRTDPTLTPSSSASGVRLSRWARVGWASALTSSGVT
jgi:hypothetical protein